MLHSGTGFNNGHYQEFFFFLLFGKKSGSVSEVYRTIGCRRPLGDLEVYGVAQFDGFIRFIKSYSLTL